MDSPIQTPSTVPPSRDYADDDDDSTNTNNNKIIFWII
jgi:hypothetical protein